VGEGGETGGVGGGGEGGGGDGGEFEWGEGRGGGAGLRSRRGAMGTIVGKARIDSEPNRGNESEMNECRVEAKPSPSRSNKLSTLKSEHGKN